MPKSTLNSSLLKAVFAVSVLCLGASLAVILATLPAIIVLYTSSSFLLAPMIAFGVGSVVLIASAITVPASLMLHSRVQKNIEKKHTDLILQETDVLETDAIPTYKGK